MPRPRTILLTAALSACAVVPLGCVRRTITITSEPAGALCRLNGREVGRTPVTVDFLYYGTYDVQLEAQGHEPLIATGEANAPWWDSIPFDLAAEISPGDPHANIVWHYTLPPRNDDPASLIQRAREMREQVRENVNANPSEEPRPFGSDPAPQQPDSPAAETASR